MLDLLIQSMSKCPAMRMVQLSPAHACQYAICNDNGKTIAVHNITHSPAKHVTLRHTAGLSLFRPATLDTELHTAHHVPASRGQLHRAQVPF